ncbi:type IX secretion system outer membrane channel protein PorV [Chitinophagaceae bacterium MMS25-I14]
MSNRLALIGLSLLAAGFSGMDAVAQTTPKSGLNGQTTTITTAVPFLRISPDARSGAMGDVGIAISPDANAQYWNVAKLPFASKKYGISVTYTPWLKDLVPDIFLAYVSGYAKFGENDNQAISGSLRYFSLGDINYTDLDAQPAGTGKPREYSFDLGYSRRLSEYLSTGLSLRYIHSAIASGASNVGANADYKPGNAFSADLGLYYSKTHEIDEFRNTNFAFGAVVSNLGSKISYNSTRKDFLPGNLGIGAAYTYQADEYNKFTIALDINKLLVPAPKDTSTSGTPMYMYPTDKSVPGGVFSSFSDPAGLKRLDVSAGLEYWYQNQFAVRAGYFFEDKDNGDRKYFTCGLGVRYNIFNLNFAYLVPSGSGVNRNPLSNTLRFSLLFEFDKLQKSESSGE